jgi:hypothetical protein
VFMSGEEDSAGGLSSGEHAGIHQISLCNS